MNNWLLVVSLLTFWLPQDSVPIPVPDPDVPAVVPDVPIPVPDPVVAPMASIEITDATGQVVVDTAPPGRQIILSAAKAIRGNKPNSLIWIVEPAIDTWVSPDKSTLVVTTPLTPTVIRIQQIVALGDQASQERIQIKVGSGPRPPPDVEPGPGPTPVDPDDVPKPIPKESLKVLIIEETADRVNYPESQMQAMYSQNIREYAKKVCSKPDGKTPDFRKYDQNVDLSKEAKWVQEAMARPRTTLPWCVVTNGVSGFSGALPKTEAEFLALLKQYGGE